MILGLLGTIELADLQTVDQILQATSCSSVPRGWMADTGSMWKLLIFLSCAFPSLWLVTAAKERSKSPENDSGNQIHCVNSFDFLSSDLQVIKSFLSDLNLMSWHFKVISLNSRDTSPSFLFNLLFRLFQVWCVLEADDSLLCVGGNNCIPGRSGSLSQDPWKITDSSCPFRGTEFFQWQNKLNDPVYLSNCRRLTLNYFLLFESSHSDVCNTFCFWHLCHHSPLRIRNFKKKAKSKPLPGCSGFFCFS